MCETGWGNLAQSGKAVSGTVREAGWGNLAQSGNTVSGTVREAGHQSGSVETQNKREALKGASPPR